MDYDTYVFEKKFTNIEEDMSRALYQHQQYIYW